MSAPTEEPDAGLSEEDLSGAESEGKDDGPSFSLGVELASVNESGRRLKEEEEAIERGENVVVTFTLPDGSSVVETFPIGQMVAILKVYIKETVGIPTECQQLTFDGRVMIDPLSLNDYPSIVAAKAAHIAVTEVPPLADDDE